MDRKWQASDFRTNELLALAREMVEKKGRIAADQLDALRARGLDDQDFVEVLGIVAMNIFTNYFNHLANPEIDFPRLDSARGEP